MGDVQAPKTRSQCRQRFHGAAETLGQPKQLIEAHALA